MDIEEILYSEDFVSERDDLKGPIIVVGLPRSGSSFLSDLISQIKDCYAFDDLYLYRQAQSLGALGELTPDQLDKLLFFLGWQIRARLRHSEFAVPNVLEEHVDKMNSSIARLFSADRARTWRTWHQLQKEWLARLTYVSGANIWGYKCPGDFANIDMLLKVYPDAKFIFLLRHPADVLSSYKHLANNPNDGDPDYYHPAAYAAYWKAAVRAYRRQQEVRAARILLIKFENLINDPDNEISRIRDFMGLGPASDRLIVKKPNSSFGKKSREGLSGLETTILRKIASEELEYMGYELMSRPHKLSDYTAFLKTTFVFVVFQIKRVFTNKQGGWRAVIAKLRALAK